MIHYVSQTIHDMMRAAVRCWLGGQIIEEARGWSQDATFWVSERDLRWWPIALEGKRVRITMELENDQKEPTR